MRIAALLTCFNRKEKTAVCLASLFAVQPDCDVYLVDDASTDGTSELIHEKYPQVNIIHGPGDLFWSRGMYTAWKAALPGDYDYYLWLNDDIELFPSFILELLKCEDLIGEDCIVSGLIGNKEGKGVLYGGSDANKHLLGVTGKPQNIKFMNGNVVLVPRSVVKRIGIIDPVLHHDLGDVDYGLNAIEHGIRVVTTTRIIALGYPNDFCRVRKWGVSLKERFIRLNKPLGSPLGINFYYRKKHFGVVKAAAFCSYLIVLNLLPDWFVERIWGDVYKNK